MLPFFWSCASALSQFHLTFLTDGPLSLEGNRLACATMTVDREKEKCSYLYNYNWRKEYLTDGAYKNLVAMIGINSVAALLTILLNAVMILAVATRHHLRSNPNILLACLAGTDLLTGLTAQPVTIAVYIERILGLGSFCSSESRKTSRYNVWWSWFGFVDSPRVGLHGSLCSSIGDGGSETSAIPYTTFPFDGPKTAI